MEFEQMVKKINLTDKEDNIDIVTEVFESVKILDNMSNIERILLTNSDAMIKNISLKNGKFVLKGILRVNILYLGENESLCGIDKNIEFFVTLAEGEKWDKLYNLKTEIQNIEFRVVKKRRIEVNANVRVFGICMAGEYINTISEEGMNALEVKTSHDILSIFDTNSTKETFTFKKDIPLSDSINIIFISAALRDVNTNASGVGVLYSAKVEILLIYKEGFEEDSEVTIEKLVYPINHFIEKDPKLKCDYYNIIPSIENVNARYVMEDEDSFIEISMDMISNTLFSENKEIDVVLDAYSTDKSVKPVLKEQNIISLKSQTEKNIKVSNSKTLIDMDMIGSVIGDSENIKYDYSVDENILSINGEVEVNVVTYIDNDSKYYVDTINLPFEMKEEIDFSDGDDLFINVDINNLVINSLNQTISIDGDINVCVYVLGSMNVMNLYGIELVDNIEEKMKNIKVKIYYKEKGESLWDIGKKNFIKADDILDMNDIENESDIEDGYPLIIR